MSKPPPPMVSTSETIIIEVYAINDNHMTNSTMPIDVGTPNGKPRTKLLTCTLGCKVVLTLNKKVILKQNLYLSRNYGCVDTNA